MKKTRLALGVFVVLMTTAADQPATKYFARAFLYPKGAAGTGGAGGDGTGDPSAPVDAPPPVDPRDKDNEDSDKFAAYVRQTGAQVYYYAGKTPQAATSLTSIGLSDAAFDYTPYGGGPGFPKSNGKTFYMISLTPSPKGEEICRKIDKLSGGSGNVGAYGGLDLNRADEGCGGESYSLRYWKRIDPAQMEAQAAVYIRNAQAVYQAVAAAGYVPSNVTDLGLTLNYYGLGGPRGSGFSYPASAKTVFSEATISDEGLCRAINVKGGGSANVGSYGNDGRGRQFGCGGDSGSMTMWYRVDPAFSGKMAAAIESFNTQMIAVANQNGGLNSEAGRDSIRNLGNTWYNVGYNVYGQPRANQIGIPPQVVNYRDRFYVIEMKVISEAACQVLANKYGQGNISPYNGKDYDRFTVGCGGDSNQLYFWIRQ
jgi:hypothetical protein